MKNFYLMLILLTAGRMALAQTTGDYRSSASGNWSVAATWESYDGTTWAPASAAPLLTNSVYIQAAHVVTVDVNSACNDLHINTAAGTTVAIGANVLEVNGKLRAYTGVAGTIPGTSTNSLPATNFITTASGGKLRVVGNTRNVTNTGEWGANPPSWIVEFALNAGQTATLQPGFKAGNITIAGGTLISNSGIRPDSGIAAGNNGVITIKNGAILRMGNGQALQRVNTASATSHFRLLTLETGGTLEYANNVGVIGAGTIDFSGTVLYSAGTAQTLVTKGSNSAGADPNIYNNLTLQESAKTLGINTTVNGTLSMRTATGGAPSLTLGAFILTYGPSALLQYRGIGTPVPSQTTADAEWPAAGSGLSMPSAVNIFNQSGVTLNGNKTTAGNISLSGAAGINAKLILGNNNLTAAAVTNPEADFKYIVTDGTGMLTLLNVGSTPVLFPVGPSTSLYHPATITNIGTADNFSVNVASAFPGCAANAGDKWVNATWNITESVAGGSDCTLSLDYAGATANGAGYNAAVAQAGHCNGTTLDYYSGSVTGTVATGSGFTSFSPFGVTSEAAVLPLQLLSFTAVENSKKTVLRWSTANEINVKGFYVQRSADNAGYTDLAFVNSGAANYSFTDNNPVKGRNYYRIKMTDNDGRITYSDIVNIKISDAGVIQVFPTAAFDKLTVDGLNGSAANYRIYSTSGQLVQTGNTGLAQRDISVKNLTPGMYLLKINDTVLKFIKQ